MKKLEPLVFVLTLERDGPLSDDLKRAVSKYVGETEKNLNRVFAEQAILLFDEADALFGKRIEVKDAHDRYVNIEIAELLKVQSCEAVTILTRKKCGCGEDGDRKS